MNKTYNYDKIFLLYGFKSKNSNELLFIINSIKRKIINLFNNYDIFGHKINNTIINSSFNTKYLSFKKGLYNKINLICYNECTNDHVILREDNIFDILHNVFELSIYINSTELLNIKLIYNSKRDYIIINISININDNNKIYGSEYSIQNNFKRIKKIIKKKIKPYIFTEGDIIYG